MILEYHSFSEEPTEYLYNRTYTQFGEDLKSKFQLITMDDGHKGQIKALAMLEKLKMWAILSISPFFIGKEKYLTWEEVRLLGGKHRLSNHTLSHKPITTLSFTELSKEIIEADRIILEQTGVDCTLFTPPYNEITPELIKKLKEDFGLVSIINRQTVTKDSIL